MYLRFIFVCRLQVSYKEKSRKCQAWEKAYGNLRSQVRVVSVLLCFPGRQERKESGMEGASASNEQQQQQQLHR